MKILYDSQIFSMQDFGGASRYFNELIFNKFNFYESIFVSKYSNNEYLKNSPYYNPLIIKYKSIRKYLENELNKKYIKPFFQKENYDIFHATYYDDYFLSYNKKPYVIDVHDMIWELFPQKSIKQKILIRNKRRLLENASAILAVSENTKKDLLKIYPDIPEKKIFVCYRGSFWDSSTEIQKKGNYILFTGQRTYYKNFIRFIKAISSLLVKYNLRLICTGPDFNDNEKQLFKELLIENYVEHIFVNDIQLKKLYESAICFVFPSLYEGFGLPILEAWSSCCPLVLSNTSCFPEIAGDAGLYFNPYDVEDIKNKIEILIKDNCLQMKLIEAGKKQIEKFQWQEKIKETSNIYKGVLNLHV